MNKALVFCVVCIVFYVYTCDLLNCVLYRSVVLIYDLPLIRSYKILCTSKTDALKWLVFQGDSSYNIGRLP